MKGHLSVCSDFFFSFVFGGREKEAREKRNCGMRKEKGGGVFKVKFKISH